MIQLRLNTSDFVKSNLFIRVISFRINYYESSSR